MKMIRLSSCGAVCLAMLACACGGDDNKAVVQPEENEGGAPAITAYPPALGPEDCAVETSEITLSQPMRAAVWGGLVLLEFEVDGGKVKDFEVQVYDPSLGAWVDSYAYQNASGQRDDGSYFLSVSPIYNDANKDQELKVRVRPRQDGCPEADWTETEAFTAGDPIDGTSWSAEIPGLFFSNQYTLQRSSVPDGMALPSQRLRLGDASLSVEFGKKGAFTEMMSFSLVADANAEPDALFADCSFVLTFTGTYELVMRQQYGGLMLVVSDLTLASTAGSVCLLPKLVDMAFSAEDFDLEVPANAQSVSINYLPTLYSEPGVPTWNGNAFGQIFQQLPQFLRYTTNDENGYVDGYVYPLDFSLDQQ